MGEKWMSLLLSLILLLTKLPNSIVLLPPFGTTQLLRPKSLTIMFFNGLLGFLHAFDLLVVETKTKRGKKSYFYSPLVTIKVCISLFFMNWHK